MKRAQGCFGGIVPLVRVRLGFPDEQIITTLEMRMKFAVGKRGRCKIGQTCVCLDGPVFTYAQLGQFPPEV